MSDPLIKALKTNQIKSLKIRSQKLIKKCQFGESDLKKNKSII